MSSNQDENGVSSFDADSKTMQSELKIEIEIKECSTAQPLIEKGGSEEGIYQSVSSRDDLKSFSDSKAESDAVGRHVENVQSNSEKDLYKLASDDVSERRRNASKGNSMQLEPQSSSKKRALPPDIQVAFGYREPNLLFRPVKRNRFAFDDNFRIGRIDILGPISTNKVLPSPSKMIADSTSIFEMFDDAEGDRTFDFNSYKKPTNSASNIRADLVAAILSSPAKSDNTEMTFAIRPNSFAKDEKSRVDDQKRRRVTNKKLKKKSTVKERMAAVAILDGEIDLLWILPREDCLFLGGKCFIFTLRQLEWVLDEDIDSQDLSSRHEGRKVLTRKLSEHSLVTRESKERIRNSANQIEQGHQISSSTTTSPSRLPSEDEKAEGTLETKGNPTAGVGIDDKRNKNDFLAAEKLEAWKRIIETWKQGNRGVCDDDQFPLLDGPMSVFFPVGTLRFLESIRVKVLFDFLCLKKTESGLAVEMFRAWRKKCGLKDLSLLSLAKHLTGINTRVEASLKRKFDAEEDFIGWVAGPMVVLSGAAKEFLVDYSKVFSGTKFIDTKTKVLADQFCDWRSRTGLSALRGSGNVAMISAWKTQIKDELELKKSEGKVIPEEEIGNEIESMPKIIPVANNSRHGQRSKRKRVKQSVPKTDHDPLSAHEALNSPLFFSGCFGDEQKLAMFKSVGITTAQHFLDASKGKNSDILKALVRLKTEQGNGKEIQIASCVSLLYDWSTRVKNKIKYIKKENSDVFDKVVEKDQKPKGGRTWKKKSGSVDPFDALSKPSKEFLIASMNIRTASEFLEARTTDIANAFIKWRVVKQMPALKGLGAVASISGWKKLVRTKAASVGDVSLAELNMSHNTKSAVNEAEVRLRKVENRMERLGNQFGALGNKSDESRETLLMKVKPNNILSVLSCQKNNVFHFELRTQKIQLKGTETYLRYLGNDPQCVTDLKVNESINDKNECAVVKSNVGEGLDKISGTTPYDSLTHGTMELSFPGYNPSTQQKDDVSGMSLEEVIRFFIMQEEFICEQVDSKQSTHPSDQSRVHSQMTIEEPHGMFNVFEVLRNGKRSYMLHLTDPIERGQSVELRYLPLKAFDKSLVVNGSANTLRILIVDRLQKLPVALLLQALRCLKTEAAGLVDLTLNKNSASPKSERQSSFSLSPTAKSTVARRRIHWLAVKIYENLRNIRPELVSKHISPDLLWTKSCVDEFRDHLDVKSTIPQAIREEIRQEIKHEFMKTEFNGFASTLHVWCPLAKKLFSEIVDLFANFSTEVGGTYVGDDLLIKLYSLVSECISELMTLSQRSRNGEREGLSKIALTYRENMRHDSNFFPSFEDIKQEYFLQPYADAMILCNEPIFMMNSIKEARIVATKKKKETTCFKDLHDVKAHEKSNIDVLWYVDTQVLAVALSAIRCGTRINTPQDKAKNLGSIDLQIIEASHKALVETMGESFSLEDFKMRQRVVGSTLRCTAQKYSKFNRRSSAVPSSLPFFFGFVWPLLRGEGWKLIAGNVPTDVTFISPAKFGSPNPIHHHKDSVARQRSQLARQSSRVGLGYIPKLTRRLLIKSSEKNESSSVGHGKVLSGLSSKFALEGFGSSLLLNVGKNGFENNRAEKTKIREIVTELTSLFNKLVPLTFEKEDDCHLTKGKQWSDVLDCRYLFKFLIIIPDMLQKADIPAQQYSHTICVVQELLTYLSKNHQKLFDEQLKLPNEEYHSESNFPSKLPSQIKNFSRMNLGPDLGKPFKKEESTDESVEIILPRDRAGLTDFVVTVMNQAIIGRSTVEHSSRHGQYRAGHPFIVCRHCLGTRRGGKYFYGTYDSIATAVSAIEKHIVRCTEIDDEVRQKVTEAKMHHAKQRKNLPFGSQSAFFVRLFDRMEAMAQTHHDPGSHQLSIGASSITEKLHSASKNGTTAKPGVGEQKSNTCQEFSSHLAVVNYIQSVEPWKSKKELKKIIAKYYDCLDYGGELRGAKKSEGTFTSEWLYSKLTSKK